MALLSFSLILMGSGPASAHASLVGSDPEDGATLSTAPSSLTFTFNENIATPAFIAVTAPDGTKVRTGKVSAVDAKVTATLAAPDQRGRYTVSYRVVSADGHPVEGTVTFSTTSGRSVTQVDQPKEKAFIHRHSAHLFWGILAAAVAIALLLAPLRRRDDKNHA